MLLLGEHRMKYVVVTLCTAVIRGVGALLHPLLIKAIFDAVSLREDLESLVYLVFFYLALGISVNVLSYILSLWQKNLDNKIVENVSGDLLHTYFFKDYRDVLRQGSGYYVARIRSDVKDGLVPMLALVRNVVVNITILIALISVLIFISWQALLILSAIIPIATFVSVLVSKKIRSLTVVERDKEAALVDTLTKSVDAFKIACSFNMVPKILSTFSKRMDYVLDSGYKRFRVIRMFQGVSDLTMVVSDACSIFVGALLVFRNQMTLGSFIAFMNAFWRSSTILIEIFRQWAELQSYSAIANRLVSFMKERSSANFRKTGSIISATKIDYGYDSNLIISKFSIHVEPGKSALIVGQNGSGKTTLANILSGYLIPSKGQLELPARISAITLPLQFPPIKVRDLQASSDLLETFKLNASDILDAYPNQLSAGQQQKIALALALTQNADLYILDEPLANLDVSSRSIAMKEIKRSTHGKILVMIMHGSEEYSSMFDQVHMLTSKPSCSDLRVAEVN